MGSQAVAASSDDAGELVLRLALGVLILFPGYAELTGNVGFVETVVGKVLVILGLRMPCRDDTRAAIKLRISLSAASRAPRLTLL